MPDPTVGDLHVDRLLSNVSIGYKPAGFFAANALPLVPVDKQTDIYAKYNKSYWARDTGAAGAAPTGSYQAVRRAPGTRARTVGYTVDNTSTYRCVNYALGIEIADELRSNADTVFNLDRDATILLTSLLNLRWDREFAADFIAGTWDNSITISNKWSDYSASTPVEDMRAAMNTLRRATLGMSSQGGAKIIMGALVYQRLLDHPDLIARIQYGSSAASPAMVTKNLIAQLFDVDEVKVCESVYTDSEEGTAEASASYSDVVSDDILLYWTPSNAQQMVPSAGYCFNWQTLGGGMSYARKGRDDRERRDWIEVHAYLDWVQTASSSGLNSTDAVD